MATTTPNFGWVVPTSTDLVKDGATAIETLGDSIDASLLDLKGGTSGQVLSKNSNTDMDFTWVTSDDANAIQNAIVDAKGDLITATAADTPARLAVGTNGQVLQADSTASTGLKWATAASGALTLVTRASFSGVADTGTTFDSIFNSTYKTYLVIIEQSSAVTYSDDLQVQFRYAGPTTQTTGYYASRIQTDYSMSTVTNYGTNNGSVIPLSDRQGSSPNGTSGQFYVYRVGNSSEIPYITGTSFNQDAQEFSSFAGQPQTGRIYTGLLFKSASTNISGTIAVYGLATA
jgi:hypothetical protein